MLNMGNVPSGGGGFGLASSSSAAENLLMRDEETLALGLASEEGSNETGVSLTCAEAKFEQAGGNNSEKNRYCLYTFFCGYRGFSWVVRARFSDLRSLDDRIAPEARAAGVPGPTRSYTLLPQRHETRPEFLRQRHREVIRYLRRVAGLQIRLRIAFFT